MSNDTVLEAPVRQNTITARYTEQAVKFIRANKDDPLFIYLPHTMVHMPLHPAKEFQDKSKNDPYSDAVEELDWSTGEILDTPAELGIDRRTLVLFTTDNGSYREASNRPLRGRKGRTDEGAPGRLAQIEFR